jgi:hypothetical protein
MVERRNEAGKIDWRSLSYAAIFEFVVFVSLTILEEDILFPLAVVLVVPLLFITNIVVLLYATIRKRLRQLQQTLVTLAVLWAVPTFVLLYNLANPFQLREMARWLVWSREYKAEVMAQPTSANGDLKHIEWDGSGFAGSARQSLVLAFDPEDTLSPVAKSHQGKFNGRSCMVARVYRLEMHWYAVLFYFNDTWGDCTPPV